MRPHWASVTCMMMCHVLLAVCSVAFVYVSKKLVDVAVAMLGGRVFEVWPGFAPADWGLVPWAAALCLVIVLRVFLNALCHRHFEKDLSVLVL